MTDQQQFREAEKHILSMSQAAHVVSHQGIISGHASRGVGYCYSTKTLTFYVDLYHIAQTL